MQIEFLADFPHYLPALAQCHEEEFGRNNPESSLEKRITNLRQTLRKDTIPATFIALSGKKLLGSASLLHQEISTRTEFSPWLAAVYVAPEYRRQGIGSALVHRTVKEGKNLGLKKLYLYTPDRARFYTRLGWSTRELMTYRRRRVVIMEIELN